MATEIRVPTLGESVTEATIGKWFKKVGDAIAADEPLVELETDKVTIEVPAPAAGTLTEITVKEGETVGVGALLGSISAGGARRRSGDQAASGVAGLVAGRCVDRQAGRGRDRQDRRRCRSDRAAHHAAGAGGGEAARRGQSRGRPGLGLRQARPGAEGRRARRNLQGRALAAGRDAEGGAGPHRSPSARRPRATMRRARSACA